MSDTAGPAERPTLLDVEVDFDTIVANGALELYDEQQVRAWFSGKQALTVREVLEVRTHPGRLFWAIMRERVAPATVLRRMAIVMAREFLTRMVADGVYVDFRSSRALDTAKAYVDGEVSLGAMRVAAVKAAQAAVDVAELDEPKVAAAALVVDQALLPDAEDAVSQVFYTFVAWFGRRADLHWLVDQARSVFGATAA